MRELVINGANMARNRILSFSTTISPKDIAISLTSCVSSLGTYAVGHSALGAMPSIVIGSALVAIPMSLVMHRSNNIGNRLKKAIGWGALGSACTVLPIVMLPALAGFSTTTAVVLGLAAELALVITAAKVRSACLLPMPDFDIERNMIPVALESRSPTPKSRLLTETINMMEIGRSEQEVKTKEDYRVPPPIPPKPQLITPPSILPRPHFTTPLPPSNVQNHAITIEPLIATAQGRGSIHASPR